MALYAIGDIHGCFTALTTLFDQNVIKKKDTVVFVGDYVDKGPQTMQVIDWLLDKQSAYNFHFIKGNHEFIMEDALNSQAQFERWLNAGGRETLDSYGIEPVENWENELPQTHWNFIRNCVSYIEIGTYIFVHAGLETNVPITAQTNETLFWKKFETPSPYGKGKKVICGHTARKNGQIADFGHTICIDTFAFGGMWLSCLNVETGEYIQTNQNGQKRFGNLN